MENESKIRKVLFGEVSLFMAVIGTCLSIAFWIVNPQNALQLKIVTLEGRVESSQTVAEELNKIKNNDLHEMQLRMDRIEARQVDELQAIARIEALLGRK